MVGPTAVGKTALSIRLAKEFDGEIINADSQQVFRELSIGTAKPTAEELASAPHHLIDVKSIQESYSVDEFVKNAREKIEDITKRGKLPILVGGTGLYVQSLLEDYSFGGSKSDADRRERYQRFAEESGALALWNVLEQKDPIAASKIPYQNTRRVIRALEVFDLTGESLHAEGRRAKFYVYDTFLIGLNTDREILYERINSRVDQMVEEGLMEEAKMLFEQPEDLQVKSAIGYKEFWPYFEGGTTFEE
ncbi:MAG: tRNA (adenosine(37)-N6)-dimethylallyltransferase MiaA, partial [Streptococcaceae bacterium]|nr:tRNA (adenosine(37)-N6)-dimethylallyltransferase MiaA [Streptococcaceae bacterium]